MSAEEEKVAPVAVVSEEPTQVDEKPKSEKKVKEKTPKSPKASKKTAEKKTEAEAGVDAPSPAEEKHIEKNGIEEEKVTADKPADVVVVATEEKVEPAEVPKKEKKEKKDKKAKEEAAAPAATEEKKDEKKPEQAAAPVRGRSNSKALLKTAAQIEEEADTAETIRLWHQPGNVRSSRILWLLKELEGTVVEHLKVSTVTSHKDKRDAIVAVNPTGEVPTLRFGNPGFSLFEPGAMFQYLLSTHPSSLLPSTLTPEERARHAQYEHWMLGQVDTRIADTGVTEKLTRTNTNWFRTTVETFLSADLGLNNYMNGEHFTATDILIGASLFAADQHGLLSHVATSSVHAYYERLRNRPHFIDVFGPPPEPKEPRSPRAKTEEVAEKKKEKKEKKEEKKKDAAVDAKPEEGAAAAPAAVAAPASPRGKDKKEKKDKKSKDEKKDDKAAAETPAAVLENALAEGPAPVDVALTRPDAEPTPTAVQGPATETQAAVAESAAPAAEASSAPAAAAAPAATPAAASEPAAPAPAPVAPAATGEKAASSESDSPISSSSSA